MADVQPGESMSKSAKRRAAKKARDFAAAEAEVPAPEPPAPEPKAKAKSKASAKAEPAASAPPALEPKIEPKAKAKGKAKAKAEPEPPAVAPKAEAKAKAQGKAEAKAVAKAEPAPAAAKAKAAAETPAVAKIAPKPAAKSAAQKAKAPAKVEEEEKPKESTELSPNWVVDDGSGGAWEVTTGMTKKQQKRKERMDEQKAYAQAAPLGKAVPGMAPTNVIPGMAPGAATKAGAKGISQSVSADVDRILAMKSAAVAEEKPAEGNSSTATIRVPESKIGIVIGPKGTKIKMIQEKTGVTRIDTTGEIFTIMGPPNAVAQAEAAVKELIEKGYCALQYDDFSENFINVHPSCFPDLIGKNGAVVRKIKEELGVEINFPETQKNAPASKKYKVGLAGSTQAVEKAKNVINNIMMYSHDEMTHPGQVHEELEIESWAWRYIIGTAGSEMKHIQNNYKVKVCIPREHSLNQQVLIVGEPNPVERAKVYIEKLVWNAEHRTSGRDKVDDGDAWGDEEPEEEWMKQYLYKR